MIKSDKVPCVRCLQGVTVMLDNPMCHLLLKPLLASMSLCLHDKAETVRVAMVELLLKVKGIRAIKVCTRPTIFSADFCIQINYK